MRPLRASALLWILVLAGGGWASASEEAARAWRWLEDAEPDARGVLWSPGIPAADRDPLRALLPPVVALALADAGRPPDDAPIVASGVVIRRDGVVLTTWRTTELATRARWLWARAEDGTWARAIPAGATWWGDLGLLRLVTLRREWPTARWGELDRQALRRPHVAIGAALGRAPVVSTGRLQRMVFLDPSRPEGRVVIQRSWKPRPKEGKLLSLGFAPGLATETGAGTAVFGERGRLVGIVVGTTTAGGGVLVRPHAYLEPLIGKLLSEGTFDPPDLGIRLGPSPRKAGEPAPVPAELRAAREQVRGGALVEHVLLDGPANGILWEGDVVLEIEGHPLFGEIYESRALALLALVPGVPADLVVLRGGERRRLQVTARRARALYPNFAREHRIRGGALPW